MEDEELLRYSRQIMLPDMDVAGQEALLAARVLIVGVGGLGSPAALYLGAAGVGHLTLCDDDAVDLSNLQRQIAHSTHSVGANKAASAQAQIAALNPHVKVTTIERRLDETHRGGRLAVEYRIDEAPDGIFPRLADHRVEVRADDGRPLSDEER